MRLNLQDLLLELYQNNTTVDKLTESLYKIVQQLNRKTEYSLVANTIIAQLGQLYEDAGDEMTKFAGVGDETQFVSFLPSSSPLVEIAQEFEHDEEALRIRKLLFCTCYGQWENNPQKLLNLNLQQLLEIIQQKYMTLKDVGIALEGIVKHLNRKEEYSHIGNSILDRLYPLYPHSDREVSLSIPRTAAGDRDDITLGTHFVRHSLEEASAFAEDTSAFMTATAYSPKGKGNEDEGELHEEEISNDTSVATVAVQPAIPREYREQGNDNTNYTPKPDTNFNPLQEFAKKPAKTSTVAKIREYDPFEVRLEVMKYSNPLRAKILAFSTLHHKFEITSKEWSSLRTLSFDELLLNLYESYPNVAALEKPLYETAGSLAEPDESNQAAEAIVQAMKPYYP